MGSRFDPPRNVLFPEAHARGMDDIELTRHGDVSPSGGHTQQGGGQRSLRGLPRRTVLERLKDQPRGRVQPPSVVYRLITGVERQRKCDVPSGQPLVLRVKGHSLGGQVRNVDTEGRPASAEVAEPDLAADSDGKC